MTRAFIRRSAAVLLLAFLLGGVIAPVVGHAFHPHAAASPSGETTLGPLVESTAHVPCVLCDAAMPAVPAPDSEIRSSLPAAFLPDIAAAEQYAHVHFELNARGPPSA
jgi:hypothetical protein